MILAQSSSTQGLPQFDQWLDKIQAKTQGFHFKDIKYEIDQRAREYMVGGGSAWRQAEIRSEIRDLERALADSLYMDVSQPVRVSGGSGGVVSGSGVLSGFTQTSAQEQDAIHRRRQERERE